jgi:phosphate transport system substrate-binding protein
MQSSDQPKGLLFRWRALGLTGLVLLCSGAGFWWVWQQRINLSYSAALMNPQNGSAQLRQYETLKEVPNVPRGLFSYGVALNFATLIAKVHGRMSEAHPGFRLRYTEPIHGNPGSSSSIRMLIEGSVSVVQSARPLKTEEFQEARSRSMTIEQVPVGIDGIVFCTHRTVQVAGLSVDQLQDIYRGKITNWSQVGGADQEIVPFSTDPKATSALSQLLGTDGSDRSPNVQLVRDSTAGIRQAATTPGGIFFSGSSVVIGQKSVRVLPVARAGTTQYVPPYKAEGQVNTEAFRDGSYPLTRRMFIIFRRDGTPDEQAGIAYANLLLSKEAQELMEKAGYVPLL